MAGNVRMSDQELAAINAAAVTREYNVKPHLGEDLRPGMAGKGCAKASIHGQITGRCPR